MRRLFGYRRFTGAFTSACFQTEIKIGKHSSSTTLSRAGCIERTWIHSVENQRRYPRFGYSDIQC